MLSRNTADLEIFVKAHWCSNHLWPNAARGGVVPPLAQDEAKRSLGKLPE